MKPQFSDRIHNSEPSFIREIFKYFVPGMISFSGGFPNPDSFPVEALSGAASKAINENGVRLLQYSSTQGLVELRQWIAQRYKQRFDMNVSADEILIVNGSQQALDLIGKVFLNKGDHILLEDPAYLGAIQSFTMFEPSYHLAKLNEDGIDVDQVKEILKNEPIKFIYTVPNFQNPSGITYTEENREALMNAVRGSNVVIIEDDPYGELRFIGEHKTPIKKMLSDQTVMMGSFSKVISPGIRLGWVCAPKVIMDQLIVAKQATDLHTSQLSQYTIYQYIKDNDIDAQINRTLELYRVRREAMISAIETYFPKDCSYTKPEGGMFVWVTLPDPMSAMKLFYRAVKMNVVFVPGDPFYISGKDYSTMRLNYTNSDPEEIIEGIKRLAQAIQEERQETL